MSQNEEIDIASILSKMNKLLTDKLGPDIAVAKFIDNRFTVYVSGDNNLDKVSKIVFSSEFDHILEEQYGTDFHVIFLEKRVSQEYTNVSLGDIVEIDNPYDDTVSIGIVVSINKTEDKTVYGCSDIVVGFPPKNDQVGGIFTAISLTSENYSGYYSGFKRKISVEEAKEILLRQVEEEFNEKIRKLNSIKNKAQKDIAHIFDALPKCNKQISEYIRFNDHSAISSFCINDSLKNIK